MLDIYLKILPGLYVTLFYTVFPFIAGLILATLLTISRVFFSLDSKIITSIIRGTPLIVQLYICKYCLPFKIANWQAGLLAFSINSAIHINEILRGAINSINKDQWNAAYVLGISKYKTILDIIMPQAFTIALPSLINEASALLKESAIISMVGETDIMRRGIMVGGETYQYTKPILIVGSIYFILFLLIEKICLFLFFRHTRQ